MIASRASLTPVSAVRPASTASLTTSASSASTTRRSRARDPAQPAHQDQHRDDEADDDQRQHGVLDGGGDGRREHKAMDARRLVARWRRGPDAMRQRVQVKVRQRDKAQQRETAENHDGREQRSQPAPEPGCPPAGLRVPTAQPQQPAEQSGQCHLRADGDRGALGVPRTAPALVPAGRWQRADPGNHQQDQQPGQEQPDPGRVRARTGRHGRRPPRPGACPVSHPCQSFTSVPGHAPVPASVPNHTSRAFAPAVARSGPAPTTGGADAISLPADDAGTGGLPVW